MGSFEELDLVHFVLGSIRGLAIFIQTISRVRIEFKSTGRRVVSSGLVQFNDEPVDAVIRPFAICTFEQGLGQHDGRYDRQKCWSLEFLLGQFRFEGLGPKLCWAEC